MKISDRIRNAKPCLDAPPIMSISLAVRFTRIETQVRIVPNVGAAIFQVYWKKVIADIFLTATQRSTVIFLVVII